MVEFCPEHSEVVSQLGSLRQGQNDIKELLVKVDTKIDCITEKQVTVRLNAAQERTKASILYWVLGIAASALILALLNLLLKALGIWKG